jgi:hypothetical protein
MTPRSNSCRLVSIPLTPPRAGRLLGRPGCVTVYAPASAHLLNCSRMALGSQGWGVRTSAIGRRLLAG